MKFSRGRLIDHLHLVVRDVGASRRFYGAVFAALGIPIGHEIAGDFFECDELFVSGLSRSATRELTGRTHLAFAARDREAVHRFHATAIAAGGTDHGAPGERAYHPGYYGAFVLDPDGNNIECVYHGPATYSASAIEIETP